MGAGLLLLVVLLLEMHRARGLRAGWQVDDLRRGRLHDALRRRPRVGVPHLQLLLVLGLHAGAHAAVGDVGHAVEDVRRFLDVVALRDHGGDAEDARELVEAQHEADEEVIARGVLHAHLVLDHEPVRGDG